MNRAALLLGLTTLLGTLAPASAAAVQHAPNHRLREGLSLNWSGYAIETNLQTPTPGVVTDVQGSWTVPTVTCPKNGYYYSSSWVGIDGYFGSNTVEQIGTEQDCANGRASYYAWYEMYPAGMVKIGSLSVSPGESMKAEVSYSSGAFTLTLNTFSTTQTSSSAQRVSAEWIEEAPSNGGTILPLADFQTVNFTGASATISNTTGGINGSNRQYDPLTMVDRAGRVMASPNNLSTDGTSFTDTWSRSK